MNNSEGVSVKIGISIYKQPITWIMQCIDSCLEQTHQDIEIHVRADGTDSISDEDLKKLQERYGGHNTVFCEEVKIWVLSLPTRKSSINAQLILLRRSMLMIGWKEMQ